MSLYSELKKAKVKMDHHYSDLYVKITPDSQEIVNRHRNPNRSLTVFRSPIDHHLWFDIPFAYDPYWEKKNQAN